jgi:hypothetical protein
VALSYEETRVLLEDNDWDTLLEKDQVMWSPNFIYIYNSLCMSKCTDKLAFHFIQLNIERDAGRVFSGFKEGRIVFAPTYKYSHNSDSYAGETVKSKKKRRTPAWYFTFRLLFFPSTQCLLIKTIINIIFCYCIIFRCDRILWRGRSIEQLSYIRGESRFSDHRPVCAVFSVGVEVRSRNNRFRKGYSYTSPRPEYEDFIPQRHSFYDF